MLDLSRLTIGLKGSAEIVVGAEHTTPRIGSGRVHVLATPVMINVMEAAALAAIEHLLPAGHQSLGIHLNVSHLRQRPSECGCAPPPKWQRSTDETSSSVSKRMTTGSALAMGCTSAWS